MPTLPLIDELFNSFEQQHKNAVPVVSKKSMKILEEKAEELIRISPWELVGDHQIISIKLDRWEVKTLYASLLGILEEEYGIILYRSLESLKQFRSQVTQKGSLEELEKIFLSQDCWFLNYQQVEGELEDKLESTVLGEDLGEEWIPVFGSIHPYEGIRSFLDMEEVLPVYVALEAIARFFKDKKVNLNLTNFPKLTRNYRIEIPKELEGDKENITVEIGTHPELAEEFLTFMLEGDEDEDEYDDEDEAEEKIQIGDDLIPEKSIVDIGKLSWEGLDKLNASLKKPSLFDPKLKKKTDGLPAILVQTTRPKAKDLIKAIEADDGIKSLSFILGEVSWSEETYDIGIIQTQKGNLHFFGDFSQNDKEHKKAKKSWDKRCKETQGHCALIVAMGLTGKNRGNPDIKDMLGIFPAQYQQPEELEGETFIINPRF